jgi:hypothetical protein
MSRVISNIKRTIGYMPDFESARNVYAVIVFLLYSWTLSTSFYQLPSWIFYMNIKEIASIYAYAFSLNILESIFLLVFILFLESTILYKLPRKDFQWRSTITLLVLLGSSMLRLTVLGEYTEKEIFVSGQLIWWVYTMIFYAMLLIATLKISLLRRLFEGFAERVVIFLYIYVPLSIVSIVVIVLRNLD